MYCVYALERIRNENKAKRLKNLIINYFTRIHQLETHKND